ncbi:TetR family transcriptional regulator [Nocardiopsis sp. RSe5-2]|uniref:TetR family transcriptional regulator n=1 Tax=Nocardiopsis endophytica TaxID=3018445 RepID=A0ABT4TZQ9_9ACTN|nr:TetR family transcriptional regulator [Nocardiopsis endophytica]MDA2810191.1 TetR family transcriptional regulator [Nocardiopsis endophytica]
MGYDAAATRARILRAATREFADHGIAGARVDRIAAAAEANKRAIYDYFGGKEQLFTTVLSDACSRLSAEVPLQEGDDLAEYVVRVHDYHREQPEYLRLLMWEELHYTDGPVPAEDWRTERYRRKVEVIAEAQRSGRVRADMRPEVLLFMLLSLVNWAVGAGQLRRLITGGMGEDELRASLRASASALLAGGDGGEAGERPAP